MTDIDYKFPAKLGACADKLYKLKESRLALNKRASAIEAEEKALKAHIINTLPASEASGIAGRLVRVTITKKEIPIVVDQEAFRKYMNRTKRWDLAYKLQPSAPAVRDLWDEGKDVKGLDKFTLKTLSMNKL